MTKKWSIIISQNPRWSKDIQFSIIYNKEKQQILGTSECLAFLQKQK